MQESTRKLAIRVFPSNHNAQKYLLMSLQVGLDIIEDRQL